MLTEQYEEVIYYLKEQGAMLNNVRPYYLFSYSDYQIFQKNDKFKDQISLNCQKINENQYNYMLADSWINVFYQMIKIYQFSRLNAKLLK
jgi:hypothetical protein